MINQNWKDSQLFDQLPIFSANYLSPLRNKPKIYFDELVNWDSTKMEIIHLKKLITIIGFIVQNVSIEIKLYLSMCKSHDCWVILALQYFGHSGNLGKLDPNIPNSLWYIESVTKSSTPHRASNEVFNLISLLNFWQLIWFLESIVLSGHVHWIKIEKSVNYQNLFIKRKV